MIACAKFPRRIIVIILLVIVFSPIMVNPVHAAPQLYEYYNASWFDKLHPANDNWVAQTFTATGDHSVTNVKLKLKRPLAGGDNPGTLYLLIKAVNSNGLPTGATLSSGTSDGNTLTKDEQGEWRSFAMSSCTLENGGKYALILYNGPGYDPVNWFVDAPDPYAGGNALESNNGGTTWIVRNDFDMNFEVWGEPPAAQVPVKKVKPFLDSSSSAPEYSMPGKPDVMITRVYTQSRQVIAGNPVIIYSNIANRGDLAGAYTATLKINGEVESTRTGVIQGKIAVPLEFTVYREEPGIYHVDLNGQKTYFTITGNSAQKESSFNGRSLAVILWCILVITVISALLFLVLTRRKSY